MVFKSITELMSEAVAEIDDSFKNRPPGWDKVARNRAITARNRAMKQIAGELDMEYREMPLENSEDAA